MAAQGTKSNLTTFLKWRRYTRANAKGEGGGGRNTRKSRESYAYEDEGRDGPFVSRKRGETRAPLHREGGPEFCFGRRGTWRMRSVREALATELVYEEET